MIPKLLYRPAKRSESMQVSFGMLRNAADFPQDGCEVYQEDT